VLLCKIWQSKNDEFGGEPGRCGDGRAMSEHGDREEGFEFFEAVVDGDGRGR